MFTSIIILVSFAISNVLSETSPTTPCTIEIINVLDQGATFEVDPIAMDALLLPMMWDGQTFDASFISRRLFGFDFIADNAVIDFVAVDGRAVGTCAGCFFTPEIGYEIAISGTELNCQPSSDLDCAQFTCLSIDGVDGNDPQCSFDFREVDRILDRTDWAIFAPPVPIYNAATKKIENAVLFRFDNGGSEPKDNQGYLRWVSSTDEFTVGDKLSFVSPGTVCDPQCQTLIPQFDTFLSECSEQYAMDRLSTQDELERLNDGFDDLTSIGIEEQLTVLNDKFERLDGFSKINRLALIAMGIKTQLLVQSLSLIYDGSHGNYQLDGVDSYDSPDSSSSKSERYSRKKKYRNARSTSKSAKSATLAKSGMYRKLDVINEYLKVMTDEVSLEEFGAMGQVLKEIENQMK